MANKLQEFLTYHKSQNRPIAFVTSGGTRTNLEQNPVRYLDNFSTGYRGAISTKYFLEKGYAVIHLWRRGSASPFCLELNRELGLGVNESFNLNCIERLFQLHNGKTRLNPNLESTESIMQTIQVIQQENLLFTIPFVTLEQYLNELEICCRALNNYGKKVLIYLAAAVSDYYIPFHKQAEHKISQKGILNLKLYPVPKRIKDIRTSWCPLAFCVSFKLETLHEELEKKAQYALKNYGSHIVIGNLLHTRHDVVYVMDQETTIELRNGNSDDGDTPMEEQLVDCVVERHYNYLLNIVDQKVKIEKELDEEKSRSLNILWDEENYHHAAAGIVGMLGVFMTVCVSLGVNQSRR